MQANQVTPSLLILTLAEFKQPAHDVFALVPRDRADVEIDIAALPSESLGAAKQLKLTISQ